MENMIPYAVISGRQWYICRDCGHKEQRKYNFCPVCKNEHKGSKKVQNAIALIIAAGGTTDVFHH